MKYPLIIALILFYLTACSSKVSAPAPVYDISPQEESAGDAATTLPPTHTIKAGETLALIALEYGLDYRDLALWNGISNPDNIYAGDTLKLQLPQSLPVAQPIKSVQSTVAIITPINKPAIKPTADEVKPIQSVASRTNATNADIIDSNIAVKSQPKASKYTYSEEILQQLRDQPNNFRTTSQPVDNTNISPSAITTALINTESNAPKQVRLQYNIQWSWPTSGSILQKFNDTSKGIDIAATKGTPVYATAEGKVAYTGTGVKSYGRLIIIKHNNNYLSAYAHNDSILVKEGEQVKRGQQIATVGDSGAARAMLHLEIRKKGKPFNPLDVLPASP